MAQARVMELVTDLTHPQTSEVLITEEIIKNALAHRSITRWAYIIHDKDVYTKKDEQKNPEYKAGSPKPHHVHVVVEMSRTNDLEVVSKWFGISSNFIKIWKGQGAFLDAVQYLTHEHPNQQALGKYFYPDETVTANFDFRKVLTEREEEKLKYGKNLSPRDKMRRDVLHSGMTLRQCMKQDELLFIQDMRKLKELRGAHLVEVAQMPHHREVYYVDAEVAQGGEGKSVLSKALARRFALEFGADPTKDISELKDYIFVAGQAGVALQEYDGQPIILLNEMKAGDMMLEFGRRKGVKELLDPFPEKGANTFHIKYGDTCVIAKYIIINGIESAETFIETLANAKDSDGVDEHKAMNQFKRRLWGLLHIVDEETFEIWINKGIFEGTREMEQIKIIKAHANWVESLKRYDSNALAHIEEKRLLPLMEKKEEYNEKFVRKEKVSRIEDIDPKDLPYEVVEVEEMKITEIVEPPKPKELWFDLGLVHEEDVPFYEAKGFVNSAGTTRYEHPEKREYFFLVEEGDEYFK